MRTTIAHKLFLGFLLVIFLNVLFLVVISRFGDLYGIARILGWQNDMKNGLVRTAALHATQRTNFVILDKLGRRESLENIESTGALSSAHIDTMQKLLVSIESIDSTIAVNTGTGDIREGYLQLVAAGRRLESYVTGYRQAVRSFADTRLTQLATAPAVFDSARAVVTGSSDSLLSVIHQVETLLDNLTRQRLADVQARIENARETTLFILAGMSLFALIFGFIFSRAITNSLRRLKESTTRIARSDFSVDTTGYPDDEIGELAQAFANMATELRRTQEELIRSKRLAAIGEIVASVNHEINNPLMIISGNAQLLEMSMKDRPEEMARLKTIIEESERISVVTRRLREIRNPVVEEYSVDGPSMINIEKSAG